MAVMTTKVAEFAIGEQGYPDFDLNIAKTLWAQHRSNPAYGFAAIASDLLTPPGANMKLDKSKTVTYGLALAPASQSGYNVCRYSTPECRAHCVSTAGNGQYPAVQRARNAKTTFLVEHPQAFLTILVNEIDTAVRKHGMINLRLNTFSDIRWERVAPWLFNRWGSAVQFYDYTKDWSRGDANDDSLPVNYHLTYSASERTTRDDIGNMVLAGESVAVVVNVRRSGPMPEAFETQYGNMPLVDGDKSDDRTLDKGVIVGLRPKGSMRGSNSPMIHEVTMP